MVMDFAARYGQALFPIISYPDTCTIHAPGEQARQPGGGRTPSKFPDDYTPVYEALRCRLDLDRSLGEQLISQKETSPVRYKLSLSTDVVVLDSYRIVVTRQDGRVTNLFVNATPQPSYEIEQTIDVTEL